MKRLLVLGLLTGGSLVLLPLSALAQGDQGAAITVGVERSSLPELPDNIVGRLASDSGEPIAGVSIEFWIQLELLGARNALLGSAVTDATGVARVPIIPRRPEYQIRASFEGDDRYAAAETTSRLTFPPERVDPVEVAPPSSPLATLRQVMPRVMGIVVALLWVFFVIAVFYVIKTIYGHGGRNSAPPRTWQETKGEV